MLQQEDHIEIFRQAWYGNRAKSVALRREVDYHTGLSFSTSAPNDRPYFVYTVNTLREAGYMVGFNGGMAVVSLWDTEWRFRGGGEHSYGPDHVSVYAGEAAWRSWYEAEMAAGGDGSTEYSQAFYDLADSYQEEQ